MNIPSINIIKTGCWQSPEGSPKSLPRFVQRYELEYFLEDSGETWIDGVHYKLSKGCAVFCTPGQMRFSRFPFKVKYLYFEVLSEDSNFADFLSSLPNYVASAPRVARLMDLVTDSSKKDDYRFKLGACAELIACLAELADNDRKIPSEGVHPHQKDVFCAISYMKKHLKERKTVSDFAHCAGYSVPHFNAMFKSLLGVTPYEYYMSLKIAEAKRLILSLEYNTTEIAALLGFNSPSHFCSAFRKNCNMSPGEYEMSFRQSNNFDYELDL